MDKLFVYMLLFTVVGARLGHCLFYEPSHYLSNPIEFLYIWEGGLASHGGAIGILIGLFIYARKILQLLCLGLVLSLIIQIQSSVYTFLFGIVIFIPSDKLYAKLTFAKLPQ